MTDRAVKLARIWLGAGWLIAILASFSATVVCAAPEPGLQSSATTNSLRLGYSKQPVPYLFRNLRVSKHNGHFAKEPASAKGQIVRGVLNFGNNSSNAVPFLWHTGTKTLYLDLNRNGDLTDDQPAGFTGFVTGPRIPSIIHHAFTDVALNFPATSSGAPITVNFNFLKIGDALPIVNVEERSFWEGKLTANGHDWQIGLLPNISDAPGSFELGQILLRPWDDRDKVFFGWSGSVDSWAVPFETRNKVLKAADAFEFSRRIFVDGCAFRLGWSGEPASRDGAFDLQLVKEAPALGDLELSGAFIKRVVLTGGPYAAVLEHPTGHVKLPVGSYNQPNLRLQSQAEAYFDSLPKSGLRTAHDTNVSGVRPISGVEEAGKVVVIEEQRSTMLTMGGPLTNCVTLVRHGQNLILTYRLRGVNDDNYKLWGWWGRTNGSSAPQFTISQNGKPLTSGTFEFG